MVSKSPYNPLVLVGQVLFYGLFAVIIAYFSTAPKYTHLEPEISLIKLSFSYHGEPISCPRERSPIKVKIDLDGQPLFEGVAPPAGLSKDGTSTIYKRFEVPSGEHMLSVKMNDNVRIKDYNMVREEKVTLKPAQILVIDLRRDHGGIFIE